MQDTHPLSGRKIALCRDDKAPVGSPHTLMIAAALACGYKPPCGDWYTDTIEKTPAGPRRQVTWLIAADVTATFHLPGGIVETLPFGEFRDRFRSRDWCERNPDHPIAYLSAQAYHMQRLNWQLRQILPAAILRNGQRSAIIPADATPEQIVEAKDHVGL